MFSGNNYGAEEGDGLDESAYHVHLLAPPNGNMDAKTLRRGSNTPSTRRGSLSSTDSTLVTHSPKRRGNSHRGGSIARLSDMFDDDCDEPTSLLTYLHGAGQVYARARRAMKRLLLLVFVSRPVRPKVVCEEDVLEQVIWVCKDCIISKLISRDLMSRKTGLTPPNWNISQHVIAAGALLESLYPKVYSNLSRKLCLTMNSPKIVRNTLILFLEVLFERAISWAKIVSMMVIASLYAEECVSQGHPDYVHDVVETVHDFAGTHLLPWLVEQGGWEGFPLPDSDDKNRISLLRLSLVASSAVAMILLRFYYFQPD